MKKQFLMVFSFLLVLVCSVSILAAPISITENFDNITDGKVPAEWKILGDNQTPATVVDDKTIKPYSAPNYLKLHDNSKVAFAGITRNIGEQPKGVLRYAVYMPNKEGADFYTTLSQGTSKVVDVALIASGNLKYRDQSGQNQTLQKIARDTWHLVEIRWDIATGTFILTTDGAKMGEFPLINKTAPDTITFKAGNEEMVGMTFIDNIELKTE